MVLQILWQRFNMIYGARETLKMCQICSKMYSIGIIASFYDLTEIVECTSNQINISFEMQLPIHTFNSDLTPLEQNCRQYRRRRF